VRVAEKELRGQWSFAVYEARRADTAGMGFLGKRQLAPFPSVRGFGELVSVPSVVLGRAPAAQTIF